MSRSIHKGFSLAELLLTVALLIILMTVAMISVPGQIGKAQDAKAKAAMAQLKRVFEEYYNDHNCYPPLEWFDGPEDCGSSNMKPYLESIPCDVRTNRPFHMTTDSTGCRWYGLYTKLTVDTGDPYCIDEVKYNYFVGSNNAVPQSSCPYPFYCQSVGVCYHYDSSVWTCTPGYKDDKCTGSNNCTMTGSCSIRTD